MLESSHPWVERIAALTCGTDDKPKAWRQSRQVQCLVPRRAQRVAEQGANEVSAAIPPDKAKRVRRNVPVTSGCSAA